MIQYLADGNEGGPRIWRMVASHNGALIITGSTEGEIIAWNAEEGTRLQTFQVHLGGDITGLFLIRNETHLISISRFYQINFWDMSSGDCLATIQTVDKLRCGVINPTNSRLYIGSGDLGKPGSKGKNIKEWCNISIMIQCCLNDFPFTLCVKLLPPSCGFRNIFLEMSNHGEDQKM